MSLCSRFDGWATLRTTNMEPEKGLSVDYHALICGPSQIRGLAFRSPEV